MISVRVPATSANLGPGYDTLGLAVNLWLTVHWQAYPRTKVEVQGEGADLLPHDTTNLIYRVLANTYQELTDRPLCSGHLLIDSEIPVIRGLGSSAAAVVAALQLAFLMAERDLSVDECLRRATHIEQHMDNVAPAIVGGATLVFSDHNVPRYQRFDPPPFPLVLAIPDHLIATDVARRVLPPTVSRQDAVFNLQRIALWIYALSCKQWEVLGLAGEDRLHQAARSALVPGFAEVVQAALHHGALLATLSGSGSTVLAICSNGKAEAVGSHMQEAFSRHGVTSRIVHTTASPRGALNSFPVSC